MLAKIHLMFFCFPSKSHTESNWWHIFDSTTWTIIRLLQLILGNIKKMKIWEETKYYIKFNIKNTIFLTFTFSTDFVKGTIRCANGTTLWPYFLWENRKCVCRLQCNFFNFNSFTIKLSYCIYLLEIKWKKLIAIYNLIKSQQTNQWNMRAQIK